MYIIAANKIVDGEGDFSEVEKALKVADKNKLKSKEFKIATLEMRWSGNLPDDYIKSACSPMIGILKAKKDLENGVLDILILSGHDELKTKYANDKATRNKHMQIYENCKTPLDGYTLLAKEFIKEYKTDSKYFKLLCEKLFKNYWNTYSDNNSSSRMPDDKWFEYINDYFRGVDCANPNVDFSGKLIIVSESKLNLFKELGFKPIKIHSCCLETIGDDDFSYIPEIVKYEHLEKVFKNAIKEARINFKELLTNKKVYLETYTCYPVVPLAFLLKSGLVNCLEEIPNFLEEHEITITGGLNLNKAAWNNTTLSNLIDMTNKLKKVKDKKHGLIHGNSSLGYQQGIIILSN